MTIELNDKERKDIKRLCESLEQGTFNTNEIKTFLDTLRQKVNLEPSVSVAKKRGRKVTRKNLYHSMLINNINGNSKHILWNTQ